MSDLLSRPVIRVPHLAEGEWLNTPHTLTREAWRGRVLLVDFWDYTCVNCIRTLPYLKAWHERYADKGLTIIGIHSPEFKFAQASKQIRSAINEFDLPYPVLLDNSYANWDRFANRAWPTKYLIDAKGYLRYQRSGEGHYQETEQAIQALLRLRDPAVELPPVMPVLREEDTAGAVCYRATPELHAGYRGGLFGGSLGNKEGYLTGGAMAYVLPGPFDRREGQFFLSGFWRSEPEAMVFAGQDVGRVVLPYSAVEVNAVLSPSFDGVELMLDLYPAGTIYLQQDNQPLTQMNAGSDVQFDAEGRSYITVKRPRMVNLVRNSTYGSHELDLLFRTNGLALYAFTFTSCVKIDK